MPDYVKTVMDTFPESFINRNNELILILRFNVYVPLDNICSTENMQCALCEYFSRECCCAMRYQQKKRLEDYWMKNRAIFNQICGTDFDYEDMEVIYFWLGNGIKHDLCRKFVRSGFNLEVLSNGY